jgi:hypothetical protein
MAHNDVLVVTQLLVVGHLGLARSLSERRKKVRLEKAIRNNKNQTNLETQVSPVDGMGLLGELLVSGLGHLALLVKDGKNTGGLCGKR